MSATPPLSVSPLTVFGAAPPDQVSAAAAAGFGAVGLRVWSAPDEEAHPLLADTPLRRETKARLEATGLEVLDVELIRLRTDSPPDEALRILDAGAYFGARFVLVVGADPDERRLAERYAAVCDAAAERGLRACLEFMLFSEVQRLADAVRIVDAAGHPDGVVLVDPLHLQRSGGSPAEMVGAGARAAALRPALRRPPPAAVARSGAGRGRGENRAPAAGRRRASPPRAARRAAGPHGPLPGDARGGARPPARGRAGPPRLLGGRAAAGRAMPSAHRGAGRPSYVVGEPAPARRPTPRSARARRPGARSAERGREPGAAASGAGPASSSISRYGSDYQ